MPEWAGNPLVWIICGVAVAGALLKAGMWISGVNSDRASFKEFMRRVEDKLDKISDRLPAQTVSSSSPIQLTDLGEENPQGSAPTEAARNAQPLLYQYHRGSDIAMPSIMVRVPPSKGASQSRERRRNDVHSRSGQR